MENKIESEYNTLYKKYKLPKFSDIDSEFEISCIENEKFLLKGILNKILEKIEFYSDLLGNLVHPNESSFSNMHEMRLFSEEDKDDMYKLYKKLMKNNRAIIALVLDNNEKNQADFLGNFFSEWQSLKKELVIYLKKLEESWEKETSISEDIGYLG
jgi:hypothetical protein